MLFKRVLFLSVFFRGFRGHNIRHHQIENSSRSLLTGSLLLASMPFRRCN
jgi:hypothetical protein